MKFRKYLCSCLVFGGVFFYGSSHVSATVLEPELVACPVDESAYGTPAGLRPAEAGYGTAKAGAASYQTLAFAVIGEQVTFFVESAFDASGRASLSATLRASGTYSLIYVEDAYYASQSAANQQALLSAVDALKQEFDAVIYPKLTEFYGKPWEPGIDGDTRIAILLTHLKTNAGGYLDTTDEYPRSSAPGSNERELLYANVQYVTQARRINSFVAHEFTHLIDFNQRKKLRNAEDEVWLNELRAEYAPTYAGYDSPYAGSNLASRAAIFLANPSDSITEWKNVEADYGSVNLFGHYLAGRYGESIVSRSMQASAVGIAAIDEALTAQGATDRFADAAQQWATTHVVNSTKPGEAYAYPQPDLGQGALPPVNPTIEVSVGPLATASVTRQTKDWSGQWIRAVPTSGGADRLSTTVAAQVPVRAQALLQKFDGTVEVRSFIVSGTGASLVLDNPSAYSAVTVMPVLMGKTTGFTTGTSTGNFPDEPLRTYSVTFQRSPQDTPLIVSASPANLLTFGGIDVVLTGSRFAGGGVTLTMDGTPIAVTPISDTELRFTAPPHAGGWPCVRLTVDGRITERCDVLRYVAYADGTLLRGEGTLGVWITKGRFRRHIVRAEIFSLYRHLSFSLVQVVPQSTVTQFRLSSWVRASLTEDPMTWRVYEVNGDATKHWITCANSDQCGAAWISRGGNPEGIFTVNQAEMNFYIEGSRVFLQ